MSTPSKVPGDFTIGGRGSDNDEMSAAAFRQEFNELRIEKLGNRITIISVIIPCLIGAILFFAYTDIKDRMINAHDTGQNEVQGVAETLGGKINAMTVDIAGLEHQLETTLTDLGSKLAELTTTKAEKKELKTELSRLEKALSDRESNAAQTLEKRLKATLNTLEKRMDETITGAAETTNTLGKKTAELETLVQAMTATIKAEKTATAALTARIAEKEKIVASLQKELILVKLKADTLEQTTIDRKVLDRELAQIRSLIQEATATPQPGSSTGASRPPKQPKTVEGISEKDLL